jgi:transposase-like protein
MSNHELNCPRCQGSHIRKNGMSRHGHQRYVCVACKATFGQVDHRRVDEELKQEALRHYAEGVGLRATERLVGPSHNSIMRWVRQEVAGQALAKLEAAEVEYVEADELWSYVGSKKQQLGCGGLLIALPEAYSAGRWAIVTPGQPERWARKFLKALTSAITPTTGAATRPSSPKSSTSRAKRTPTSSKA